MAVLPTDGRALFSAVTPDNELHLTLEPQQIAPLGDEELLVRVEAAPINPSDLGLMFGPLDGSAGRVAEGAANPTLIVDIPDGLQRAVANRSGLSLPIGNEGAGTVVAAGASPRAQALIGRVVATFGGAMYRSYRTARVDDVLVLPEGSTARDGASLTVNPLTALSIIGTMRRDGRNALVHTAAASNLGQMLSRLCAAEGIPLVNIVRSPAQVALLKGLGAAIVLNSSEPDFFDRLTDALVETGATVAFDAIGGGRMASTLLTAMEAAQTKQGAPFSVYGSSVPKQVYIYGALDGRPTELGRGFGLTWSVSGWLLTNYLMSIGREEAQAMRERVIAHRDDLFASTYTAEISLSDLVDPAVVREYYAKATGRKYLLNPSL